MRQLDIRLLGRFEVVVDSRPVPATAWPQRRATDLVKVLALAPGHRLPRDEVLETLWPLLSPDSAAANLHKAASNTRRALGDRGAIVLRSGMVELAPDATVMTDVAYVPRIEPDKIELEWVFGWGVRYQAFAWGAIDLAVRHREDEGLGDSTVMVRVNGVLDLRKAIGR